MDQINQTAINLATDAATCTTSISMNWPEAFAAIGIAFAATFMIYVLDR